MSASPITATIPTAASWHRLRPTATATWSTTPGRTLKTSSAGPPISEVPGTSPRGAAQRQRHRVSGQHLRLPAWFQRDGQFLSVPLLQWTVLLRREQLLRHDVRSLRGQHHARWYFARFQAPGGHQYGIRLCQEALAHAGQVSINKEPLPRHAARSGFLLCSGCISFFRTKFRRRRSMQAIHYFPGGNTAGGFCSHFGDILPAPVRRRMFYLKGGRALARAH